MSSPLSGHVPNNSDILKAVYFFYANRPSVHTKLPDLSRYIFLFSASLGARSIQPKFRPVRAGKVVHLKRRTSFFETFPIGPNRSIECWTEISGNFGRMDRALSLIPSLYRFCGLKPVLGSLRPSLGTGHVTRLTVTLFRSDTPKPRLFATALQSGLGPIQTNPNFAVSKLSGVNWA